MEITTFRDETAGDEGGYEQRGWVSLRLTPSEARDLSGALSGLASRIDDPGWHVHVSAWDGSREIVLFADRGGALVDLARPSPEDLLDERLSEIATNGGSVMNAVNAVMQSRNVDASQAKEILREHSAWRDRL